MHGLCWANAADMLATHFQSKGLRICRDTSDLLWKKNPGSLSVGSETGWLKPFSYEGWKRPPNSPVEDL